MAAPARVWVIGAALAITAIGAVAWELASRIEFQRSRQRAMAMTSSMMPGAHMAPWERDVLDALETGVREVGLGDLSQAEVTTDKATAMLTAAQTKSQSAGADFFQQTVSGLDRIWNQRPDSDELFKHVAQARIELAALRTAQNQTVPARPAPPSNDKNKSVPGKSGSKESTADTGISGPGKPRSLPANSTLNPGTLGNSYLDATLMPASSEILLPPVQRSLQDNVRVENLTIAGGSQTLDGIRWSNVTFVGTRLRYEKGWLDLENVHFVGCTFGFSTDERGARLANAIALGQTSFTAQ